MVSRVWLIPNSRNFVKVMEEDVAKENMYCFFFIVLSGLYSLVYFFSLFFCIGVLGMSFTKFPWIIFWEEKSIVGPGNLLG